MAVGSGIKAVAFPCIFFLLSFTTYLPIVAIGDKHDIHHEHIVVGPHPGKLSLDDQGGRRRSQGSNKHGAGRRR